MEALIKMVCDKTGISQQQASTAVQTVVSFLKDKMPAGLGNQVESFLQKEATTAEGNSTHNILNTVGGMFGK